MVGSQEGGWRDGVGRNGQWAKSEGAAGSGDGSTVVSCAYSGSGLLSVTLDVTRLPASQVATYKSFCTDYEGLAGLPAGMTKGMKRSMCSKVLHSSPLSFRERATQRIQSGPSLKQRSIRPGRPNCEVTGTCETQFVHWFWLFARAAVGRPVLLASAVDKLRTGITPSPTFRFPVA